LSIVSKQHFGRFRAGTAEPHLYRHLRYIHC